jgi:adenosylhomocysteine nucleosidase
MKKIVIITAMKEELEAIKNKFEKVEEKQLKDLTFFEGQANGKEYILVKCGVGKVNAARVTQILIDNFDIEYIINIGIAGSLNDELEIGDIVIGKNLVQHDFDITAFGHEKGYITDTGRVFQSNENLIKKYSKKNSDYNIIIGTIASGDIFCNQVAMKEKIRSKFGADCVEMEGAAIAQVATLNKIPFIVIRSISDKPNGRNHIDIEKFINMASKRCADLVIEPTIHP